MTTPPRLLLSLVYARWGLAPWLGLAGLLASTGLFLLERHWQSESAQQQQLYQQLLAPNDREPRADTDAVITGLTGFQQRLLTPEAALRSIEQLWQAAETAGLQAAQLDIAAQPRRSGGFGETHLRLPVRGSYTAIRQFALSQLAREPALALVSLTLQVDETANGLVVGTLHFSLLTEADHAE